MEGKVNNQNIEQGRQMTPHLNKKIKYGIIYFLAIFVITGTLIGLGGYNTLTYANIYEGVYINDIHVGGQNKTAAFETIKQAYEHNLDSKEITLSCDGINKRMMYKDIGASYDINKAIVEAYNVGREGNVFSRLIDIARIKKNHININLTINVDPQKLTHNIQELSQQADISVTQYETKIEGDQLHIKNGIQGKRINLEKAYQTVLKAIEQQQVDTVVLEREVVKPTPIEVEDLYEKVYEEPTDAYFKIEDYKISIVPHSIGKKFDKEQAKEIIVQHKVENEEFNIPLILSEPAIQKEDLENQLFKDTLSSYTTSFNAGNTGRTHNIKLAASKINNIVLGPGDEFSFNDIVGERTIDTGYKNAHVYMGDEIVDGVGGGICQVSTTLYNAILFSDLNVTNRVNHSMTVGYVPFGQDAAVAYGLIDFKFRNNTTWPIKLLTKVEEGNIMFTILGTNELLGKSVEIENVIKDTIEFPIEYVEDPELPEGETKIKQNGGNGYIVETYKIIKQDGKEVSKTLISKSKYRPIKQIIIKGTKKVEVPTQTPEQDIEQDVLEKEEQEKQEEPIETLPEV